MRLSSPLGTGQPVQPITEVIGSEVIAAMPIYSQAKTKEPWIGTVLLARSTKPLDHEILELWVILGSIAVGGDDRRRGAGLRGWRAG